MSKMEAALSGSISDHVRMGLFDNMDSETLPGSRLESFAELLHRHVSQSSSGYNADVSGSFKSDSASLRMSRFSIASTFETAPIACSSMLSRASLEPPSMPGSSEFAMPRHPVRQKTTRTVNGELAKPSSPNAQSKEEGTGPPPSNPSLYPDSTECSSAVNPETESEQVISKTKDQELVMQQASAAFTAIKGVRKRGRKPKIPEVIKETESSTDTPPKKRRGRPPLDGTPAKNRSGASGSKQEPQNKDADATQPPVAVNPGQSHVESGSDKLPEDYIREVEEAWRDERHRSYEIGNVI